MNILPIHFIPQVTNLPKKLSAAAHRSLPALPLRAFYPPPNSILHMTNSQSKVSETQSNHLSLLPKIHRCFSITFRLKFQLLNVTYGLSRSGLYLAKQSLPKPPTSMAPSSHMRPLAVSEQNLFPQCISVSFHSLLAPISRADYYGNSSVSQELNRSPLCFIAITILITWYATWGFSLSPPGHHKSLEGSVTSLYLQYLLKYMVHNSHLLNCCQIRMK